MGRVNIGFLAHGPASANSLKPLIDILRLNNMNKIHTYAYHDYVSELWDVEKNNVCPYSYSELDMLDILIYGTGSSNKIETEVAGYCKKRNIKTISILDLFWDTDKGLRNRFPIPPDFIVVPDEQTALKVRGLVEGSEVLAYGNPHFDRLSKYSKPTTLGSPMDIAVFTQCSTTGDYSDISRESLMAVEELIAFRDKYPELIKSISLKNHPREDTNKSKELCHKYGINFYEGCSQELLIASDFIYGDTCTLQYEALMIGKPVYFFRDGLLENFIFSRLNTSFRPQIKTVGATFRVLNLIRDLVDEIILVST